MKKKYIWLITSAATIGICLSIGLSSCGSAEQEPSTSEPEGTLKNPPVVLPTTKASSEADPGTVILIPSTSHKDGNESSSTQKSTSETTPAPKPTNGPISVATQIRVFDSVIIVDDTAYELYTYIESTAKNYASIVTKTAESLKDIVNVYDMVIPTSTGIRFEEDLKNQINSSDQKSALQKIGSFLGKSVKQVNIYHSLLTHKDKYLYFRTDHHWTALGAYYAYVDFCASKGIEPNALSAYQTVSFPGFLGSFYKDTKNDKELAANPDTVTAYYPLNRESIDLTITDSNESTFAWPVIMDVTDYDTAYKYNTFIGGDNPISVITNSAITDGSSCIVVKESFGNAFVPFLTDHYQTIYVIDYRYWNGKLLSFAKQKKVTDIIFVNNIGMTRSSYLVGKLAQIVQ